MNSLSNLLSLANWHSTQLCKPGIFTGLKSKRSYCYIPPSSGSDLFHFKQSGLRKRAAEEGDSRPLGRRPLLQYTVHYFYTAIFRYGVYKHFHWIIMQILCIEHELAHFSSTTMKIKIKIIKIGVLSNITTLPMSLHILPFYNI